ncbi:hypothetical protein WICMUC_004583 [Wickerhamomyces mucosus]|uniref:Rad21/Rec8-like protein N-terminal domain-containing protein n=1 Tax=Wickerhamomyces mucosus TaxID=1378264 RepID=A0A9P8PIA2_9ASCO|nr:hypothetical protein WICMUC_004583 [Wickerhamomyces mucosus]
MIVFNQDSLIHQHSNIATVWLLSTLGFKSSYKRISKKQIQEVSIPETCEMLAKSVEDEKTNLRVNSNLLYGVAVVYKQQINYLESDVVNIKSRLQRDMLKLNKGADKVLLNIPANFSESESAPNLKDTKSVFLHDDPLFDLNEDLLPPFDISIRAQSINQLRIKKYDLLNNTIHSSISDIDNADMLFSNKLPTEDDALNDIELAFDDNGYLLELNEQYTPENIENRPLDGDTDLGFDFSFGGDYHPRSDPGIGTGDKEPDGPTQIPKVDKLNIELRDILNKVPEVIASEKIKHKKSMRMKRSRETMIQIDKDISLTTDNLRHFRDCYLEFHQSNKKSKVPLNKEIIKMIHADLEIYTPVFESFSSVTGGVILQKNNEDDDFIDRLIKSNDLSEIEQTRRSTSRRNSRSSIASIPLNFNNENIADNEIIDYHDDFNYGDTFDYEPYPIEPIEEGIVIEADNDSTTTSKLSASGRRGSSLNSRFETVNEENENFDRDMIRTGSRGALDSKSSRFYDFLLTKIPEDQSSIVFNDIFNGSSNVRSIIIKSFYEILQLNNLNKIKINIINKEKFKLLNGGEFEVSI